LLNKASSWLDALEQRIEDNKSHTASDDDDESHELGYDANAIHEELPISSHNKRESTFDLPKSSELNLKESSPELAAPDGTIFKSESSKSMDRPSKTSDIAREFMEDLSVPNDSLFHSKSKRTSSNIASFDEVADFREQHEGMVKLWEKERANLKKAQQLLLKQKDGYNQELDELEDSHQKEMDDVIAEYDRQIAAKNKTIESLEESLAAIKEERNSKIEGQQELNELIAGLEAEKEKILQSKAAISREKQEQIASIRSEFEVERRCWEKERKILTKNFERENFLQNENVQNTNALARSQSALQQKELENARLQGEIRWLKQDKEEISNTNAMLKDENDSCQQQIEALNQIVADKNGEILEMKEVHIDSMNTERAKYSKLQIEYERTKETMHQMAIKTPIPRKRDELNERVKELRNELLTKQTDLDRAISQRNEFRIRLTKMEDVLAAQSREERGLDSKGNDGGLIRRGKRNGDLSLPGRLPRKKYTKWKAINDSIGIFDRLGLEFAHVLRNKPWLRLLIVFYIIILHLWCFMVLHFSLNFEQDEQHY